MHEYLRPSALLTDLPLQSAQAQQTCRCMVARRPLVTDDKLLQNEVKLLLALLPKYAAHVDKYPHTLLIKFYGLHRVRPLKGAKVCSWYTEFSEPACLRSAAAQDGCARGQVPPHAADQVLWPPSHAASGGG